MKTLCKHNPTMVEERANPNSYPNVFSTSDCDDNFSNRLNLNYRDNVLQYQVAGDNFETLTDGDGEAVVESFTPPPNL